MRTLLGGRGWEITGDPDRAPPGDCTVGQEADVNRRERDITRFTKPRTGPPADAYQAGWQHTEWQGTAWSRVAADDWMKWEVGSGKWEMSRL